MLRGRLKLFNDFVRVLWALRVDDQAVCLAIGHDSVFLLRLCLFIRFWTKKIGHVNLSGLFINRTDLLISRSFAWPIFFGRWFLHAKRFGQLLGFLILLSLVFPFFLVDHFILRRCLARIVLAHIRFSFALLCVFKKVFKIVQFELVAVFAIIECNHLVEVLRLVAQVRINGLTLFRIDDRCLGLFDLQRRLLFES